MTQNEISKQKLGSLLSPVTSKINIISHPRYQKLKTFKALAKPFENI